VDSGSELFGNATRLRSGDVAENGFDALAELDNGDARVDPADTVYFQLRLWTDRNHNGISEASELQTLRQAGVVAILTTYRESRWTDPSGNVYRYVGTAVFDRKGHRVEREVFDVFLTARNVASANASPVLSLRTVDDVQSSRRPSLACFAPR
jgi:hypothetical protein